MTKTDLNEGFERTSFLYGANAQFIEQLYARYLNDPASVDPEWQQFFAGLEEDRDYRPEADPRALLGAAPTGRRPSMARSSRPSTAIGRR